MEKFAEKANGEFVVAKVNLQDCQAALAQYHSRIAYVPTVLILKQGQVMENVDLGTLTDSSALELLLYRHR